MRDKCGHGAARGEIYNVFAIVSTGTRFFLALPFATAELIPSSSSSKGCSNRKFMAIITGNSSICPGQGRLLICYMGEYIPSVVTAILPPSMALISVIGEFASSLLPSELYLLALSPPHSDWLRYCSRSCTFPNRRS